MQQISREAVVEQALDAAFPGLPECMTMDEARRRISAAVDALWPVLERRGRERAAEAIEAQPAAAEDLPLVAWAAMVARG